MLTHDWKDDKVILLIPGEQEPANQSARLAFPLYGEMVANMVFSEETLSSHLAEVIKPILFLSESLFVLQIPIKFFA